MSCTCPCPAPTRLRFRFAALAASLTALVFAWSPPAAAQIGTGWVAYDPPSSIQLDGSAGIESYPGSSTSLRNEGASFSNEGGIETFALHDPISNRAERRMQNTYLSGKRQFEGEVRVSPPTDDESVMQVFGGNSGATTQMIRAFNEGGGTLKKVPGFITIIDKIHGVWVKVNVIHDIPANTVKTYINGQLVTTGDGEATNAGTDGWYHKYGCYGTLRTGSAKVEWRNVKHFRDGTSPPGDASAPDAATNRDAAVDVGVPDASADLGSAGGAGGGAGAGGNRGAGGAGGSSGNGGTPGAPSTGGTGGVPRGSSGGAVGTGGSSTGRGGGAATEEPSGGEGCGCRVGAASDAPAVALLSFVALLAFGRSRRRRG